MLSSIYHLLRLTRGAFVLAREGVFTSVDPEMAPPPARPLLALARLMARPSARDGSTRIVAAFARLGPSYVKLGQFLATRPDVVGAKASRELEKLQDRMPAFPRETAVGIIEASFNKKLGEIFVEFGEPVAAASIAQVHRAKARDGDTIRDVAVKVLRPGVARNFARDLSDMYFAARIAEKYLPEARRLRAVEVVDTLARTVRMEMDFRLEAAAASEFAEKCAGDPEFRVPTIDWDRTAKDVMTLEWIDGIPLSDIDALRGAGIDLPRMGRIVIQSFLRHAMRDGLFHADMHQGNLFVDLDGKLAAVDFGIMGRLGLKERRFLAEILYGFITRDYQRVAEVHFEAGYVPDVHRVEDFAQAIRAIGEPIHSRTADQISMAKLLTLLFEITALFDMRTRTELVLLQKTMMVVEGVARGFDPKFDIWATSEPVVGAWIADNLGPLGKIADAGRHLGLLGRAAGALPEFVTRVESITRKLEHATEHGFALSLDSLEGIGAAEAKRARWTAAALWVIALVLVAMFIRG